MGDKKVAHRLIIRKNKKSLSLHHGKFNVRISESHHAVQRKDCGERFLLINYGITHVKPLTTRSGICCDRANFINDKFT